MQPYQLPLGATGPGSQPTEEDGASLQYLSMPKAMQTYAAPSLPWPEEAASAGDGLAALKRLHGLLSKHRAGSAPEVIDLSGLTAEDRDLINQTLGEGEVSILCQGVEAARLQETRLAGVWRVRSGAADDGSLRHTLEVADIPAMARSHAFADARDHLTLDETPPSGVVNAPSVLVELNDRAARYRPGEEPLVINLTLLPQTEADLEHLDRRLGTGPVSILSRGYGNCRITATALRNVWWVQYFNSEEKLILNTLEVTDMPAAALAAQEDIEDSAARLEEVLEALQ